MITTVCMNPSFDKTVEVDAMTVGGMNRIRTSRTDPGGKGINVAVVCERLGVKARCVGCMGEEGADRLSVMLDGMGLEHDFLRVPGEVRTNTKVVSRDGQGLTELNEAGPAMNEELLKAFFELAADKSRGSDCLVITGSLPPNCPKGTYRDLIRAVGVPCVLDVGGAELTLGCEAKPFLVKPNKYELEVTMGRRLDTLDEIVAAARQLLNLGAQNALVSLGGDGALLVMADKAYYAPIIPVEVHSTVGAGDSMVGGVLAGLAQGGDLLAAFRMGVAAGTASVMTEGTQLIVREDYEKLLDHVVLQEV